MPNIKFKTTADIKVPKQIIEQVIGQNNAVNIIKKAAEQRRHVLLIGEPGTGKSMLGMGLAELLPKEKLMDIISFPNPNDENTPLIRTMPAGKGRETIARSRLQTIGSFKNQTVILFILVILSMITPWWIRNQYKSDIMFAAFFLGSMMFLGIFVLYINLSKRMPEARISVPKVIVDNFDKKHVPFYDATGAHAGALLGDVLHDPFQTFFSEQWLQIKTDFGIKSKKINEQIDTIMDKGQDNIISNENNYEAVYLPKNELYVLGETNCSVSPVEVLSSNRYDYVGEMIKLTTSENKELIVTPEHKIAVWKDNKMVYVESKDIKENDKVVAQAEDIIIDEDDIIATYDERQQKQCKLYYQCLGIKSKNPSWGYKRIAKSMGQNIGKTRWWHSKKHIPVPIQTADWLKEKGLLPLRIDNKNLPLIAKVLGATFGDGGIFDNLNGIFLSSSELESVKEFGKDIENIFNLDKDQNSRIIEGGEHGHSWCYQNTNRSIIRFLLALGAPKGNKTKLNLRTPNWIKLDNIFENEFYGSFLGGELGTPIIHKNGNYLTSLEVGITGLPNLKNNRISFLNELSDYLRRNRVSTTSIYEGKTKKEDVAIFRLLIEKKMDNVLLFLMNTKINYCKHKIERMYVSLAQWAKLKKDKYYELLSQGYGAERAMKVLNLTPNSLYLLLDFFAKKEEVIIS